jgi:hypothetical protein
VAAAVDARVEQILREAASAVAQLSVQRHLLQEQGRPVAAVDVLSVAGRLVRVLEQQGLTLTDAVGARVAYDAGCHLPLQAGQTLPAGTLVTVRFPGIAFRGKILARAQVEPDAA